VYEPNVEAILAMLRPDDVVVDIGGWACPFNRANYIIDSQSYETRGFYSTFGGPAAQGGSREFFTAATWIGRDLCDRTPLPFADKSVDFVICSHTLEDVRDPLWISSEMIRIGKRGYVEVPSRECESSRGWEHPRIAGLSHHRWLIEIDAAGLRFLMKYHMIHAHWRFSLPPAYLRSLPEERRVQWLFWEDSFQYEEVTIHGLDRIAAELEGFVERTQRYPRWRLALDRGLRQIDRGVARLKRTR